MYTNFRLLPSRRKYSRPTKFYVYVKGLCVYVKYCGSFLHLVMFSSFPCESTKLNKIILQGSSKTDVMHFDRIFNPSP